MNEFVLQILGTLAFVGMSLVIVRSAANSAQFKLHGRDMLVMVAYFFVVVAVIRTLPLLGILSHSEARTANGIFAVATLALMLFDYFVSSEE